VRIVGKIVDQRPAIDDQLEKTIPKALTLLICILPIYGNASISGIWHMVNVNSGSLQGDAHILIVDNTVVMIDAGYASEARNHLVPYLRKLGIRRVAHFFVSHPHRDHYEGLKEIISDGVIIENLYYKVPATTVSDSFYNAAHFSDYMSFAKDRGAKIHHPATGFRLDLSDNSYIELVHAQEGNLPNKTVDVNDLSLVMRWKIDAWSILFTGDLNETIGQWLADNKNVSANILKVPHHGGRSIAPPAFFSAVKPGYAAVPGPEWVWCGERGNIARTWLGEHQIPTWINGIDGHVRYEFEGLRMRVNAEHPTNKCKVVFVPNGVFIKAINIEPAIQFLLGE